MNLLRTGCQVQVMGFCTAFLLMVPQISQAQALAKHLASPAPAGLTKEPNVTLKEFVELANDVLYSKYKASISVDAKAFEAKYPDLPLLDAQLDLTGVPTGMNLSTVLQIALDQLAFPATFSVKGDSIKIIPGQSAAFKDMGKASPLTTKLKSAKIKLADLDKVVQFKTLVTHVTEKAKIPVYVDSVAFRTGEPDAPSPAVLEINLAKIKDGDALHVLQEAVKQLKESYPQIQVLVFVDHVRITQPKRKPKTDD